MKEGEIPIIQRPPFDDLSIWRHHIYGAIVGVIGTEGIKQLKNKPGWVRENNVRIYLNGSVIPEDIINAVAKQIGSNNVTMTELARRVPGKDYVFNIDNAKDIIKLFEEGSDIYLPGK